MTDDEILALSVAGAICQRLALAAVFAHPDDKTTHWLETVERGIAKGRHGITGKPVSFPASECFDPNTAMRLAKSIAFANGIAELEAER